MRWVRFMSDKIYCKTRGNEGVQCDINLIPEMLSYKMKT